MDRLILNCDLGEDETFDQTEQLLDLVDAANICCGYHAGDPEKTAHTVTLAHSKGLMIGAHPGLGADGGRGTTLPSPLELSTLLERQLGDFSQSIARIGARLEYVKLHGSLYHAVEQDRVLRNIYLDTVNGQAGRLAVFALAGGSTVRAAKERSIPVYEEAFLDRAYQADGSLIPRSSSDAILSEAKALARLALWLETGQIEAASGRKISLAADTFCVHGDTPDALRMIARARELLDQS